VSVRVLPIAPHDDIRAEALRPGAIRGNYAHRTEREIVVVLYSDRWTLFAESEEPRTFNDAGAVRIEIDPGSAYAIRNDGGADLHLFISGRTDDLEPRMLVEPLTRIAGVDGCRNGWIAVVKDANGLEARVLRSDEALLALFRECAVVAIDVPIGLSDDGGRLCDHHARRFLGGKRASSVFPAPLRPLLAASTYPEANSISRNVQKRGISKQCWAIVPKIAQIDEILQRHREVRGRVYEVHPEISFRAWAQADIPTKHSAEGLAARRKLAEEYFGELPATPRPVHENDLLDAIAALWTAERILAGTSRELGDAHVDRTGLAMRIVY
jgi:predicted RNase H-like nuclease